MGWLRRTTWRMPRGMAMISEMRVDVPTSTSVLGSRWAMTLVTPSLNL